MENFFLEEYVCWCHDRAQQEYEAPSRNWIWLDKFTSYVITLPELNVFRNPKLMQDFFTQQIQSPVSKAQELITNKAILGMRNM